MQRGWKKSRTVGEDREDIVKADQQDKQKLQYKKKPTSRLETGRESMARSSSITAIIL